MKKASLLNSILEKIAKDIFEFSEHAVDQSVLRNIAVTEVREAINHNSKVIKIYPDDKYGPSCLILGYTEVNRPLHIQCSFPSRPILKIITLYEPDPSKWIDLEVRRKQ